MAFKVLILCIILFEKKHESIAQISKYCCIIFTVGMDTPYGIHGYDDFDPNMKPIFLARGPRFKSGITIDDEFVNIDLYHLFCKLLNLKCISIDGINRENIWRKMLKK